MRVFLDVTGSLGRLNPLGAIIVVKTVNRSICIVLLSIMIVVGSIIWMASGVISDTSAGRVITLYWFGTLVRRLLLLLLLRLMLLLVSRMFPTATVRLSIISLRSSAVCIGTVTSKAGVACRLRFPASAVCRVFAVALTSSVVTTGVVVVVAIVSILLLLLVLLMMVIVG